jgi:hypothetical protein
MSSNASVTTSIDANQAAFCSEVDWMLNIGHSKASLEIQTVPIADKEDINSIRDRWDEIKTRNENSRNSYSVEHLPLANQFTSILSKWPESQRSIFGDVARKA